MKSGLEKVLKWGKIGLATIGAIYFLGISKVNAQDNKVIEPVSIMDDFNPVKRNFYSLEGNRVKKYSLADSTQLHKASNDTSKFYKSNGDTIKYGVDHDFRFIVNDTSEVWKTKERGIDFDVADFNKDGYPDLVILTEKHPAKPRNESHPAKVSSEADADLQIYVGINDGKGNYNMQPADFTIDKNCILKIDMKENGLYMLGEVNPIKGSPLLPGYYYAVYDKSLVPLGKDGKFKDKIKLIEDDIEVHSKELPSLN